MNFKHSLLSLTIGASVVITGCGGSGGPSDARLEGPLTTPEPTDQELFCTSETSMFQVAEFVPANEATNVAVNASARVTFNAIIDPNSVDGNLRLEQGGNVIMTAANVVGKSVVLDPATDLMGDTVYSIVATTGLRADCGEDQLIKSLGAPAESSFTTTSGMDNSDTNSDTTAPRVTATSPTDGETLAATDSNILIEFDEAIDPTSVNAENLIIEAIDESGNSLGQVDGTTNPVGNTIEFDPTSDLDGQTFYQVTVGTSITDLAGNALENGTDFRFKSGGLVVLLNDSVVSQIPALGDGLNTLGGALLSPLEFGDSSDGLSSLDNVLLLQVPLVDGLTDLLGGAQNFTGTPSTIVNGTEFTEFSSAVVAACDPKSVSTDNPQADCALGLDLGLDVTQLQSLADAFTGGNVEQIPNLIQALAATLTSGDFNNLPPELADVLGNELFPREDGLGVELRLVDDGSLPLPGQAEDALLEVLDGLGQIPVLGELFSQTDGQPLVDVNLLEGELLGADLGGFLEVGVLSGTEQFIGENGVINLGGALFDSLLMLAPDNGSGDIPFTPEDLPLLGDLLTILDIGNFDGIGAGQDLLAPLTSLLGLGEGTLTPEDLPVLGEVLSLLDPAELGSGDALNEIPVLGDLIEQLLALNPSEGGLPTEGGLDSLPLVGDILNIPEGGVPETGTPLDSLTGLLDPNQLTELPVVGDLLGGLLGGT